MKYFSDLEIVQAIREGNDTKVIDSLYATVLPTVKKHVCNNGGSLEDAFDVFQDALMVFYKLVVTEKYDSEKYKVHGFVFAISKNLWINLIKKRINSTKREKLVANDDLEPSILENLIDKERKSTLDLLFQSMGEKCTEILTMFFYHKYSLKEIAQKLGDMSEDAVKVKSHRCKKLLANKVKANKNILEQLRN